MGNKEVLTFCFRRSFFVPLCSLGWNRSGDNSWMSRVGDGMRSKWYKLMGGEQRKRLWVLKTTSQNSTGPKPKVRPVGTIFPDYS